MMILYHADGTRSVRVRWLLEEMGLPYELREVPFPPRVRAPAHLTVNPAGSLPFFTDGSIEMTESMAICEYVAAQYGPTPMTVEPEEAGFAAYRQFCWYGEASLVQPVGTLFRYTRLEPPGRRPAQVVSDARALLTRRLQPVARALRETPYLAADRPTLADISVSYALGFAASLGEASCFAPEIEAYQARLARRPAYRRAYGLDCIEHREAGDPLCKGETR